MQGHPRRGRAAGRPTTRKRSSRRAATPDAAAFGKRLARARKNAGLTQVDLARALDRDQSMISHLERGHIGKMAELLRNLARELGVSADYLLGLTDSPAYNVSELCKLHAEMRELLSDSNGKMDRLADGIDMLLARLAR